MAKKKKGKSPKMMKKVGLFSYSYNVFDNTAGGYGYAKNFTSKIISNWMKRTSPRKDESATPSTPTAVDVPVIAPILLRRHPQVRRRRRRGYSKPDNEGYRKPYRTVKVVAKVRVHVPAFTSTVIDEVETDTQPLEAKDLPLYNEGMHWVEQQKKKKIMRKLRIFKARKDKRRKYRIKLLRDRRRSKKSAKDAEDKELDGMHTHI
jgi:hypothetical protein